MEVGDPYLNNCHVVWGHPVPVSSINWRSERPHNGNGAITRNSREVLLMDRQSLSVEPTLHRRLTSSSFGQMDKKKLIFFA